MTQIEILSTSAPVSMGEDWFDIANTEHFWIQWRFQVFKKNLKGKYSLGNDLLEIGCGSGTFKKQIEDYLNIPVVGCDLNLDALQKAENGMGKFVLYNIFDKNKQLTNRFSSVFLMDVVEHLDDDIGFLEAASAHLKPGGLLFINVPAGMYLFSKYDTKVGHIRRYNKVAMRKLIENAGLEPLEIKYWAGSLIPIALIRKLILRFSNDTNIIKTGFSPPGKIIHAFLKLIKKIELIYPFNIPLGASVFAIAKLPEN